MKEGKRKEKKRVGTEKAYKYAHVYTPRKRTRGISLPNTNAHGFIYMVDAATYVPPSAWPISLTSIRKYYLVSLNTDTICLTAYMAGGLDSNCPNITCVFILR